MDEQVWRDLERSQKIVEIISGLIAGAVVGGLVGLFCWLIPSWLVFVFAALFLVPLALFLFIVIWDRVYYGRWGARDPEDTAAP